MRRCFAPGSDKLIAMSVFIDDLVGLALRVFGTTEGSIITRLFTILKKEIKSKNSCQ
jgi:hypothetical protein